MMMVITYRFMVRILITAVSFFAAGIDRDLPAEEQYNMRLYTIDTSTVTATLVGVFSEPGAALSIVFAPDGTLMATYWWGSSKWLCER